jgi:flagellar hook-associated protein 2
VASATGAAWGGAYDGSGADAMTVHDAYTGKTATIALAAGATVDSVLAALNDQFDAQGMGLAASRTASGELVLTGTVHGSSASFTVGYRLGGSDWGGAAPTGLAAGTYAGLDVAGTIGGEAATGAGRVLTAAPGTIAEGLSLRYAGNTLGAAGTVTHTTGLAGAIDALAESFTDATGGLIAEYARALDRTVTLLQSREADIEGRLARYEERLIRQYTAMEAALSKLQNTGSWLSGQIGSLPGFSSPE